MRIVDSRLVKFHVSDDVAYLTTGQVRLRYGVSDSWIDRHVRAGMFPAPIKFPGSKQRRWKRAELERWEKSLGSKLRAS